MNIFVDPLLFIQFMRQSVGGIFDSFFVSCSFYGETVSVLVLMALFYWCLDKKVGEYLLIASCASNIVTSFLKNIACIYRPWILDSRISPVKDALPGATGYSFPSGHSANATGLFGGLIIRGKYSRALKIVFAVCMVLIIFSRLYVCVHSVLDVLSAFIYTIFILLLLSKLFDMLEERPNLDIAISVVGLVIAALVTVYTLTKGYPMDYDSTGRLIVDPAYLTLGAFYNMGLISAIFISWPIERRFIKFSDGGSAETKIVRFLCGFLGIGFIATVIIPLIGTDTPLGSFIGMFVLGLFVMLIYPAVIRIFQNHRILE